MTINSSTELFYDDDKDYDKKWYTGREWERIVGWGTLPDKYKKPNKHEIGYQYDFFIDIE